MFIKSVMSSTHLILCHPLLLLPPIPPSIRVFSNESVLRIRWPKYWSFSFNISPSNEHPGLISFRMDRLDLLAVQGTLKSLLQYHSSKASILLLWDFPGKNTGVVCHFLLQGIFPIQESKSCLVHLLDFRWRLYHLNHLESPKFWSTFAHFVLSFLATIEKM